MAIITHPIEPVIKQLLERWRDHVFLTLLAAMWGLGFRWPLVQAPATPAKHRRQVYTLKKKRPVVVVKQHHGSAPLLPDFNSGRYQEVLAAAIVWARGKGTARSETPAIFIQKICEWTEINKAKGAADPRPYRSYQEWCDHNFPAQNFESIQRVIEALEKLGLLTTEPDPDQSFKKRFAVNEDAVRDLVGRWADAHPEIARNFRGTLTRLGIESPRLDPSTPRLDRESQRLDTESHKVVKKASNQLAIKGASPKDARPLARNDNSGFEGECADSDSHSLSDPLQSLDTSDAPHDVLQDGPIPRSEAPLTQAAATEPPGIHERVSSSMTAGEVWRTSHQQLSVLFDRPSFDMWLKEAQLRAYAAIDGTCTFTVGVPTAQAVDMLQYRYYRKIQRVFEGLANQPVSITFEVLR
jgi:hypothetical protein